MSVVHVKYSPEQIRDICQNLNSLGEFGKEHLHLRKVVNGVYQPTCGKQSRCIFYKAKERRLAFAFNNTVAFLEAHQAQLKDARYCKANLDALKHLVTYFSHKSGVKVAKLQKLVDSVTKAYDPQLIKKQVDAIYKGEKAKEEEIAKIAQEEQQVQELLTQKKLDLSNLEKLQKEKLKNLEKQTWIRRNVANFFIENVKKAKPDVTFHLKNKKVHFHSLLLNTMVAKNRKKLLGGYFFPAVNWEFEHPEAVLYANKIAHFKQAVGFLKVGAQVGIEPERSIKFLKNWMEKANIQDLIELYFEIDPTWGKVVEDLEPGLFLRIKRALDSTILDRRYFNDVCEELFKGIFANLDNHNRFRAIQLGIKVIKTWFNDANIDWSLEKCYTKDFRKNLKRLKDLAQDVDLDYVYFYFQFSPKNKEDERREGLEGLRSIADKHTRALFHVGCSLLEGKLIEKNEEQGRHMLLLVKEQNSDEYAAQVDALLAGIKKN